jgi:hypothetical protein
MIFCTCVLRHQDDFHGCRETISFMNQLERALPMYTLSTIFIGVTKNFVNSSNTILNYDHFSKTP